jgi:signal transduction histidine kinase
MALLSPIRAREISGKDEPAGRFPFAGVTIILLDPQAINERLLPRLASRYFSEDEQLAYRLSVVSIRDPARVLFRAPKDAAPPLTLGDVSKGLFRIRLEDITEEEWRRLTRSESQAPPDRPAHFTRFLRRGFGGFHGDDSAWRLTATHRAGSVDAIVAAARRRNLAVSFGILAVLAMAVGLIVVSAQRARRLARREIELVASVSHELRTPLSVIQSASENLADGVVRDTAQARHYGELIRDEARRLGDMVERTLAYANVAARRRSGERQLIDVGGLVQAAVDACADIRGDTQIEVVGVEGLPAVRGDREALKRALRNLIENAIKFGGDARWLRIEGEHVAKTNGGEIHLRVIDRGVGVARDERDAIFEPFERGREAVRRRIPGSGLGLSIVRRIVEAHGGRVMLKSAAGQGSVFVITLPCDGARGGEKA